MFYRDTEVIVMESGTAAIIRISGRLDHKIADTVLIKIEQIQSKGFKTIIFDLENTTYISSLGLGIIASTHEILAASGGKVKISGIKGMIGELFKITGLINKLEIHRNISQAVEYPRTTISFGTR